MLYEGTIFEDGAAVDLDDNQFVRCIFKSAVFHYNGGNVVFTDCVFANISWELGGHLGNGLRSLASFFAAAGQTDRLARMLADFAHGANGPISFTIK